MWQHIFWIFGHPDVYIQFVPAVGIVSTIIPVFVRRRLVSYTLAVASLVATGFLSFGLWVHHMFATGLPELALAYFSAASVLIAIPTGIQIFVWLATIWHGKPVWDVPLLFVIGFLVTFVLGGLTGVMVALVPFDLQAHDSYFVVAHFHYVLIGGVVFPIFAAFYYWGPKFLNKMFNKTLGVIQFWLLFIGFNLTFFPLHIVGLMGMPRRVYTYEAGLGWGVYNLLATIGAFIIALSILVFIANVVWLMRRKETAPANPWNADSLEWATPTPAPSYGFRTLPIVHSRYPLWDQETMKEGDPATVKLIEDLAAWPSDWRGQLVTSTLDAKPQEVFRVAAPSIWPLVTAVALMAFSFLLIFDLLLPAAGFVLLTLIGLIGWHSQDYGKVTRHTQRDEEFERKHGIPVRAEGSRSVGRGAMLLTILSLGVALLTLIFSYLYLRLSSPEWPPAGIELPELLLPSLGLIAIFAAAGGMFWASRGVTSDRLQPIRLGVPISVVLGIAYIALHALHLLNQDFTLRTHAYGSLYFTIMVVQLLIVLAGLTLTSIYWVIGLRQPAREQFAISNYALFWGYLALSGAVVFITLCILPYVL